MPKLMTGVVRRATVRTGGEPGMSSGAAEGDGLLALRALAQAALNQTPRFKLGVMAHDSYWLAARLERARTGAQVRRLLLLVLEAFNEKPRFLVPSESTDSYAIAARLDRWVAASSTSRGP